MERQRIRSVFIHGEVVSLIMDDQIPIALCQLVVLTEVGIGGYHHATAC